MTGYIPIPALTSEISTPRGISPIGPATSRQLETLPSAITTPARDPHTHTTRRGRTSPDQPISSAMSPHDGGHTT